MTENAIVIAKRTATNFHLDLAGRLVAVTTSLLPLIEGFPPRLPPFECIGSKLIVGFSDDAISRSMIIHTGLTLLLRSKIKAIATKGPASEAFYDWQGLLPDPEFNVI